MIENDYIIQATNSVFAEKQFKIATVEQANEDAFMSDAQFSDVKYQLKSCIFDLQKAKAFDDEKSVARLEEKRDELVDRLNAIKKELKVSLLTYQPTCSVCGDSGFIDGKRCGCYYKTMNTIAYRHLGIKEPRLHSFCDNTLSDEITTKRIEKFTSYADKLSPTSKNLLFFGERGTGKTFFAECIADRVNGSGKNALFINAFQLNDIFLSMTGSPIKDAMTVKQILIGCDLLVIDDLGAATVLKKITAENLLMIISERVALTKPFIVTTNLTLGEINEKFDERIFSRMCGKTTVKIRFEGKDLRLSD